MNLLNYTYLLIINLLMFGCQPTAKKTRTMNDTIEYQNFMTQEHRFELNGCNLKYNGKPFGLGMSLQQFEKVFGKEYEKKETLLKLNRGITLIAWYKKNIITELRFIYDENNISILVYGSFLSSELSFEDFLKKSSELSFEDFLISDQGYSLSKENCDYEYFFSSPVAYHRKGGGHLYVRGDWKLNETNPVDFISIYRDEEK